MSAFLILALSALRLNSTGNELYFAMPRFWTNTGFCPMARIEHKEIKATLKSNEIRQQLRHISGLPTGSITHIRIHWLLEMIQSLSYNQAGTPIYDFDDLDEFLIYLIRDLNLRPVIEFMGDPGKVFSANPNRREFLFKFFSSEIAKHYLKIFGANNVQEWRFETWNEPDLKNYNLLSFDIKDYLTYANAIRGGLKMASFSFKLRGPAGLFKSESHHPLCWHVLEYCNSNKTACPFDVISYHRKGNGTDSSVVIEETSQLLKNIYEKYPNLRDLPISNDEADPISGWSTPRDFQADGRYAFALVSIVIFHWGAYLEREEFKQLETISHDNAFLSYHPYEFKQRTMLAHFRMNETDPPHSQFIQKPVFAALGLLGKLAPFAAIPITEKKIVFLKTKVADTEPLYVSWIIIPENIESQKPENFTFESILPFHACARESYAYIIEILEKDKTDPVTTWKHFGSPAYPDAKLRELMRRNQTPSIHEIGYLNTSFIHFSVKNIQTPWILLLRVCSNLVDKLEQPQNLMIDGVTHNEVFLTWRENINSTRCLKSYEVWFRANETVDWQTISAGWHLPFPSFQYAAADGVVNGFYKVRGMDIFNRYSRFSEIEEYMEI